MKFANARIYTVKAPLAITEELLAQTRARDPGPLEISTQGWAPPFGKESDRLLEQVGDVSLMTLRTSKRRLPGKVVKAEVEAKVAEIEKRDSRKVYRGERSTIKEEVITQLLPRAFVEHSFMSVMLLPGYIVIDTASENSATDALNLLREALGSLPCLPLLTRIPPYSLLTDWLRAHAAPGKLSIGTECLLQDDDDGQIRIRGLDLDSEQARNHLQAGMIVSRLSLQHDQRGKNSEGMAYFELDDKMVLRRIDLADLPTVQAEDHYEELQGSLAIVGGAMAALLSELVTSFGGINDPTTF